MRSPRIREDKGYCQYNETQNTMKENQVYIPAIPVTILVPERKATLKEISGKILLTHQTAPNGI